jgi:hypothetical protein
MPAFIMWFVCLFKGHQWGRSYKFGEQPRHQFCDRCAADRIVEE